MPSYVILDNASLQLGAGPPPGTALTELACWTNHLELTPDVDTTTLDTMCGSVDLPGVVKWALVATLYQSFDADGTEETLSALVEAGDPCVFLMFADRSAPISPTNPAWTGEVIPQPYSPLNGDAGDASEIEIEWSLVGEPTKLTAPPAAAATSRTREKAAA